MGWVMKPGLHAKALSVCAAMFMLSACDQAGAPSGQAAAERASVNESFKDFGEHVVHFNAFTTEQLKPETAQAYGIARAQNRAMVNITVLRKSGVGLGSPVAAAVTASASNLTGQLKSLKLREIVEGDREAIYYIGDLPVSSDETLLFDVRITPEGHSEQLAIKFQRRFAF